MWTVELNRCLEESSCLISWDSLHSQALYSAARHSTAGDMAAPISASAAAAAAAASSSSSGASFGTIGLHLRQHSISRCKSRASCCRCRKSFTKARAVATPATAPLQQQQSRECTLPTWSQFELGKAPVYWKTQNGHPPTSGEGLTLFYNPAANNLTPNDQFGIAFNGGFNQPIMCGGEPRKMSLKVRGKADLPIYSIRISVPKHALSLIFSFTNGVEWDGPYTLQFEAIKSWKNKPLSFFNEGLAEELAKEGACERAIFPDANIIIRSCEIGSFFSEGGDRCKLDLVAGCMDPNSHLFDPFATVDDGTCTMEFDSDSDDGSN